MSKRKSKTLAIFLVIVLVLLIVGMVVSLLSHKQSDVDFSLVCNNQTLSADNAFYIDQYNVYVVDISISDYDVKVVPNYENDIVSFNVDHITRTLKDVPELTNYFIVDKKDDSFVVRFTKSLPDMLSEIYDGYTVENASHFSNYGTPILNLVVTEKNGANAIIPLLIDNVKIVFNYEHIAF